MTGEPKGPESAGQGRGAGRRLRVVLVTPTLEFGGAEQQVALLAATLDRSRFEVTVRCLHAAGPLAGELAAMGIGVSGGSTPWAWPWRLYGLVKRRLLGNASRQGGVGPAAGGSGGPAGRESYPRRIDALAGELLYGLTAVPAWLGFLRRRPDLVHAFQNHAKVGILAARLAGCAATCYTEVCLIGDVLSPTRARVLARCLGRAGRAARVVAMSDAIRAHLVAAGVDGRAIVQVPTMIDCATVPAAPRRPDGPVRLAIVGRLVEGKGHRDLLAALALLRRTRPVVELTIAGDGPLRPTLEEDIRRLELAERVRMPGNFASLAEVLGPCDIFVLPSLSEGMPVSILEAMAYGKAVVASRVGGIPEEVEDGVTGLLVPAGEPAALAAALEALARDPARVERMGAAGRRRVLERFDAAVVTRRVEDLYRELAAEAGQR